MTLPLLANEQISGKEKETVFHIVTFHLGVISEVEAECYFSTEKDITGVKGRNRHLMNTSYMPRTLLGALTDPISFNSQNNPVRQVLCSFSRGKNWNLGPGVTAQVADLAFQFIIHVWLTLKPMFFLLCRGNSCSLHLGEPGKSL